MDILLTEPEAGLDRVTQELARIFDVPGAFISFTDEDTQYYKSIVGELPEPYATTRTEPRGSLCSHVVGMNDELIVEDLCADERFRDCEAVIRYGVRFYAGTPLRADSGRAVGAMCIVDLKPRRIAPRERELLRLLAEGAMAMVRLQAASRQLLERRLQMERDLGQAVRVQRFLLPPDRLEGAGWRIEHRYRPVEHLGGDFLDVYRRPDGSCAIIVGDVSGHGTSAALTTTMARTAFRRAAATAASPAEVLDSMFVDLSDAIPPNQFITALAAMLSADPSQLSFASAGHPHPLHVRHHGAQVTVAEHDNSLPLGVAASPRPHRETAIALEPGDRVLIYTDGAVEVGDRDGRMLGAAGIARLAAEAAHRNDCAFLDALIAGIESHSSGALRDDIAILSIETH